MTKIVICGSLRFEAEMKQWAAKLTAAGLPAYAPQGSDKPVKAITQDHFEQIEKADVIFCFNKNGYLGTSTTLELGYSLGQHKPIWALEDELDSSVAGFVKGSCKSPEELIDTLK